MKMLRNITKIVGPIGLTILLLTVITKAENSERKCPKKKGNFPIPGSLCKSYLICKDWRAIGEAACKSNEHFNPIKGWCDYKHLYPCLEKPKSKECLRDNGRFLKPGTKCVWYYDCCNGEAKEKKCEKGKLFDKYLEKCVSSGRVVCKETETSSEESTSSESTSNESSQESKETIGTTSIKDKTSVSFSTRLSTVTTGILVSTTENIISTSNDDYSSSTFQELSSSYQTTMSDFPDTTFQPTSSEKIQEDSSSTVQTFPDTTVEPTFETRSESLPDVTSRNTIFPDISPEISTKITVTDFKPEVSTKTFQTTLPTSSKSDFELTSDSISSTTVASSSSLNTIYVTHPETTKGKTIQEILTTKITQEDFSTIDPVLVDFVCPEPTGYYPHPTDKHKFIGCVHNRPSVLTCPSNLVYNDKQRRCLYNR